MSWLTMMLWLLYLHLAVVIAAAVAAASGVHSFFGPRFATFLVEFLEHLAELAIAAAGLVAFEVFVVLIFSDVVPVVAVLSVPFPAVA